MTLITKETPQIIVIVLYCHNVGSFAFYA